MFLSEPTNSKSLISKTQLPDPKSKPRSWRGGEDTSQKKKRSIWNWRPLKVFSRSRRFKCSFHVHVHSIQGLPSAFNGASFRVHWKRRDAEMVTSPAKVSRGVAEFGERLEHTCRVQGSISAVRRSAKYETKHFLIYANMVALPELNLGKHRVDLTRLLPVTLEELEGDKRLGKWGTSFKLSGKASGAVMNVCFGYSVVGDKVNVPLNDDDMSTMSRSLPSVSSRNSSSSSQSVDNVTDLHVVTSIPRSELAKDKPKPDTITDHVEPAKRNTQPLMDSSTENGCDDDDDIKFSVIDRGIEWSSNAQEKSEEVTAENTDVPVVEAVVVQDDDSKVNDMCTKESLMKDLESALKNVTNLEVDLGSLDSLEGKNEDTDSESDNASNGNTKSRSFNDVTESEFLKMLSIDDSPNSSSSGSETGSPGDHMLRQFEKDDTRASTSSLLAVETDEEELGVSVNDASSESSTEILADTFESPLMIQAAKVDRAKTLEDLETEALMSQWGLNEDAFQYSPPKSSDRSGSPVPVLLPPLGEGLGPFLHTKGGGFVQTMKPSVFRDAKSRGSLVMHVSGPVVLPAKMGSAVMEILQGFASIGTEKLFMKVKKLMPLDDITGKTMQQVAQEGIEEQERRKKYSSSSARNEMGSEYVSLDDLAPLAADKIEELLIEGLRIQSGVSDYEAPSTIRSKSIGGVSAVHSKSSSNMNRSFGLQGAVGLQLLDLKAEDEDDVDGLMGLSLTLDEWMKFDYGEIDDGDRISERKSKILAAYNANSLTSRARGLLGNNITIAMMVQLCDLQRNYEPVGAPMLCLVQVERMYSSVSMAELKITQVHVTGLEAEPGMEKLWGGSNQQQSGSRWLLANGMGKNNKNSFVNSKVVSKSSSNMTTNVQSGESLWSISSRVHGSEAKWKDMDPLVRNPNVLFRNETIRLRLG